MPFPLVGQAVAVQRQGSQVLIFHRAGSSLRTLARQVPDRHSPRARARRHRPHRRERLEALLQEATSKDASFADFLDLVLGEEVAAKTAKNITMGTHLARFPVVKSLDSFDFAYQPGLDKKQLQTLSTCQFPGARQSMHHFVADAPWDAAAVLRVARVWVLGPMVRRGPVAAWIVDDTGFPKKGQHSVGVARQYCGILGEQDNCQVAVSVSVAKRSREPAGRLSTLLAGELGG